MRPSQTDAATRATRVDSGCARRTAFELSLVRDRGGRPTPVAAANWFARHGGVGGIPRGGWRLTEEDRTGATLISGQTQIHAVQGSDGTWQVDSGTTCVDS